MRVLMLTTSYPRYRGDHSGIFVQALAQTLCTSLEEVAVLAPSDAEVAEGADSDAGVTVHRFRYSPRRWERLFYRPAGGLPQRLRRPSPVLALLPVALAGLFLRTMSLVRRYDVVHCHWFPTALVAILPCRLWRKPLVVTARGSDVHLLSRSRWGRMVMMLVLRSARATITVNREFEDAIGGLSVDLKQRVRYVPNGTRTLDLPSRERGSGTPVRLLFVGGMTRAKGLADLFAAIDSVWASTPQVHLTLAGPAPDDDETWFWQRLQAHEDRVTYLGIIEQDRVLSEMHEHDLLVLPSHREGRPNVILEAMANGLPVVASALPGIKEMGRHGHEFRLVRPGDPASLAEGLTWCIEHPEELRLQAQTARRRIAELGVTWENCAREHLAIYQAVGGEPET